MKRELAQVFLLPGAWQFGGLSALDSDPPDGFNSACAEPFQSQRETKGRLSVSGGLPSQGVAAQLGLAWSRSGVQACLPSLLLSLRGQQYSRENSRGLKCICVHQLGYSMHMSFVVRAPSGPGDDGGVGPVLLG